MKGKKITEDALTALSPEANWTAWTAVSIKETTEENLEEIRRIVSIESMATSLCNWWIGKLSHAMCSVPDKYGSRIVEKVAETINRKKSFVYMCMDVYKTNSDIDEFRDVLTTKHNLGFTHLAIAATVSDKKKRESLIAKADKDKMTVEAVRKRVKELAGGKAPSPKQQKSEMTTPIGNLSKIDSKVSKLMMQLDAELEPLERAVKEVKKKKEVREKVSDTMEELKQNLIRTRNELDTNIQELETVSEAKGMDLFRKLRDTLKRQCAELKPFFPLLNAEMVRMGDTTQVDDTEWNKLLSAFEQASTQASRLSRACQTIMEEYRGLADG